MESPNLGFQTPFMGNALIRQIAISQAEQLGFVLKLQGHPIPLSKQSLIVILDRKPFLRQYQSELSGSRAGAESYGTKMFSPADSSERLPTAVYSLGDSNEKLAGFFPLTTVIFRSLWLL